MRWAGRKRQVAMMVTVPIAALLLGAGVSTGYDHIVGAAGGASDRNSSDWRHGRGSGAAGESSGSGAEENPDAARAIAPTLSYGYIATVLDKVDGHYLRSLEFKSSGASVTSYGTTGTAYANFTVDTAGRADIPTGAATGKRKPGYGMFKASILHADVLYAAVLESLDLAAKEADRSNTIGLSAETMSIEYDHGWYGKQTSAKAALLTITVRDADAKSEPEQDFRWSADGTERREAA